MSGDLCWKLDKREEKPRAKNQKTTNKQKIVERLKKLQDGNREREGGTRYKVNTFVGLRVGKWSVISHPRQVFPYGGPTDRGGRA